MSQETLLEDNPDTYLIESSVPDVRAFEQKTRNEIETQKKELRAMVGEQYHDLISAADSIVTMSKKAQAIQSNFGRMQDACNINLIKQNAKEKLALRDQENNQTHIDTKRRYIYVIAALVKSLADVPEQIWHALENHRYLHASRLYTLARKVHEYLDEEKEKSDIDIEVAFPVIQRQWDAVSAFGPQIVQRATHYLRVSEQSSEHVAEVVVGLLLLDNQTYKDAIEKLLEMRTNVIRDILQHYTKTTDNPLNRIKHQLREISLIIKRTLIQTFEIFVSKEGGHEQTLIESYVESFLQTFLIPSKSSHGNETPSQPAVTRLFSPSSNVHLIVRYLPEAIQKYTPQFDPSPRVTQADVQRVVSAWMQDIESMIKQQLPETLLPVQTQSELVQVRSKLWELLETDENTRDKGNKWQLATKELLTARYSMWDKLYRQVFNDYAKRIVDKEMQELSVQPNKTVWPLIVDPKKSRPRKDFSLSINIWPNSAKYQDTFSLPNLSSSKEIEGFKSALKETANDRTDKMGKMQVSFDDKLKEMIVDMQPHFAHTEQEHFHTKEDADMIKSYFQEKCFQAVVDYDAELKSLMQFTKDWANQAIVNDVSIFLGRLVRNIALLSKELPKAIALSAETKPVFELRSSINNDPQYTKLQSLLLDSYHDAHESWIQFLKKEFAQRLKSALMATKWDDQCPAIAVWENVEEDVKLPIQASNAIVRSLFYVCQEIQRINSAILDQTIMTRLRQQLNKAVEQIFRDNMEELKLTESGALQLMFDYMFLNTVLQQESKSIDKQIISAMQEQIDPINWASYEPHFRPCVNKFYIKQSLLFGVLTSASNDTYERARKVMSSQQQGQHNVLPIAPQATRFTLLPIGHLTFSSLKAR